MIPVTAIVLYAYIVYPYPFVSCDLNPFSLHFLFRNQQPTTNNQIHHSICSFSNFFLFPILALLSQYNTVLSVLGYYYFYKHTHTHTQCKTLSSLIELHNNKNDALPDWQWPDPLILDIDN
jgi:hypothetical protein